MVTLWLGQRNWFRVCSYNRFSANNITIWKWSNKTKIISIRFLIINFSVGRIHFQFEQKLLEQIQNPSTRWIRIKIKLKVEGFYFFVNTKQNVQYRNGSLLTGHWDELVGLLTWFREPRSICPWANCFYLRSEVENKERRHRNLS